MNLKALISARTHLVFHALGLFPISAQQALLPVAQARNRLQFTDRCRGVGRPKMFAAQFPGKHSEHPGNCSRSLRWCWLRVGSDRGNRPQPKSRSHRRQRPRTLWKISRQISWHVWQLGHHYYGGLKDWAGRNGVRMPVVPPNCTQAYHMFYLLMPSREARHRFIARLQKHGILSVFHYLPLHLSDMGRRYGGASGDCPVAERVSDQIVRVPIYNQMTEAEQSRVIRVIRDVEI